jgi:hypothetical protein
MLSGSTGKKQPPEMIGAGAHGCAYGNRQISEYLKAGPGLVKGSPAGAAASRMPLAIQDTDQSRKRDGTREE